MTLNVETLFLLQWDDQFLKSLEYVFSPSNLFKDRIDGKKQGLKLLDFDFFIHLFWALLKRICLIKQKFGSWSRIRNGIYSVKILAKMLKAHMNLHRALKGSQNWVRYGFKL